jgi:hypothetical protein
MFGNLLAFVALRRTGQLLTGLVFAIIIADSGNTTELRLPAPIPKAEFERFLADRPMPTSAEERKKLLQEFLLWRKAREHRLKIGICLIVATNLDVALAGVRLDPDTPGRTRCGLLGLHLMAQTKTCITLLRCLDEISHS